VAARDLPFAAWRGLSVAIAVAGALSGLRLNDHGGARYQTVPRDMTETARSPRDAKVDQAGNQ